jgi:hypothetical protein
MIQSGSRAADAKVSDASSILCPCPRQRHAAQRQTTCKGRERKIVGVSKTNALRTSAVPPRSGPPMCPLVPTNHPGNHRRDKSAWAKPTPAVFFHRSSLVIRLMNNFEKRGEGENLQCQCGHAKPPGSSPTPTFAFSAHTRIHPPAVTRRSTTGGAGSRVWPTRTYNVCVRRPLSTP